MRLVVEGSRIVELNTESVMSLWVAMCLLRVGASARFFYVNPVLVPVLVHHVESLMIRNQSNSAVIE